ncbi:hypothetical protein [Streptomyces sp. NPDC054765]
MIRCKLSAELDKIKAALRRLVKDYALHPDRYPEDEYDEARWELEEDRRKALAQLAEYDEEAAPEEALPTQEDFPPPMWTPAVKTGAPVPSGGTLTDDPSVALGAVPDGIAWHAALDDE